MRVNGAEASRTPRRRPLRVLLRYLALLLAAPFAGFFLLDAVFPLPAFDDGKLFARVVTARDGTPLRAFADANGVWRYSVKPAEVSPNYIEALLNYEDRWFWRHPGVNPAALARAAWQNITHGGVVSGGSTLTMQVARLLDPNVRSLWGKMKQAFRALQLETHHSKEEILALYLNRAPFGGPLEGVQAASFTYLGKSAARLSDAEAALLAVLPQAPSRYRPDRYPKRAQQMRDKVLERLAARKVWTRARVDEAKQETVWAQFHPQPMLAPLLSQRLIDSHPGERVLRSTLDANLQQGIATLVSNRVRAMPPGTSIAVLVMENQTLAVRAYVGSGDFGDRERYGHVDMAVAVRSPGSTLKPFVYGMAIDAGLIHAQSLLTDAPSDFGDYRPENFDQGYAGPVSVTEALQRSLNVPAVQVLEKFGSNTFMSALKNAGMALHLPEGAQPNLALGLGGAGTTLEALAGVYSALANSGHAGKPRLLESDALWQRRLLSEGAAWIVRDMLYHNPRPDQPAAYLVDYRRRPLAWKTGTSYGFRDSWAIGVTADYTVGVWAGRPDGTPLPGYYGALAAAPILFTLADNLPPMRETDARFPRRHRAETPSSVTETVICWPLGQLESATAAGLCHRKKRAYILDGNVPRTFPDGGDTDWSTNPVTIWINPKTGRRVDDTCATKEKTARNIGLWPKAVESWIEAPLRRYRQIPAYDRACARPPAVAAGKIKIAGLRADSVLRPAAASEQMPRANLQALGGQGKQHWFINGALRYILPAAAIQPHAFEQAGRYTVTVVDEQGQSDEVSFTVAEGQSN